MAANWSRPDIGARPTASVSGRRWRPAILSKPRGAAVGETPVGARINHIAKYGEIAARKSQVVPCLTSQLANYNSSAGSPPNK
jgi:hypothetical protein